MRRIFVLMLGLCMTIGMIGCKEDTNAPVSSDPAAPAGDADSDGDANASDEAPADPAEQ